MSVIPYEKGKNPNIDDVLMELDFAPKSDKPSWWEVVEFLFFHNYENLAAEAQLLAAPLRPYCTHGDDICLSEEALLDALQHYWSWGNEYGQKVKFSQEDDINALKDNPDLLFHIITRAEIMGFKHK